MKNNNNTFVCFPCRTSARRHEFRSGGRCSKCAQPLTPLHDKIEIPKKGDDRGWEKLQATMQSSDNGAIGRLIESRRKHRVG